MSGPALKKLTSTVSIPQFGLGTWLSKAGEVGEAVKNGIEVGYRHIDCAYVYGNEAEIGNSLAEVFAAGQVKREDIFLTSKCWNTFHRKDLVEKAALETIANLQCQYLDLYLIHWPQAYIEEKETFPKDENGKFIYSDVHFMETWRAMENLVDSGKVRAIGVSNFNSVQIQQILEECRIRPANIQIESHPYFPNAELIEFCQNRDITVTIYSPFGSPNRPWAKPEDPVLFNEPVLVALATKLGRSVAQIVLRWGIQRDLIVIPKSVRKERLLENFNVFDFELSKEDMQQVYSLARENGRGCVLEWVADHPLYPFHEKF